MVLIPLRKNRISTIDGAGDFCLRMLLLIVAPAEDTLHGGRLVVFHELGADTSCNEIIAPIRLHKITLVTAEAATLDDVTPSMDVDTKAKLPDMI